MNCSKLLFDIAEFYWCVFLINPDVFLLHYFGLSHLSWLQVYIVGCFIMGFSSIILLLEKSPLLYHAYLFMTIFLWTRIVQNFEFIKAVWRELSNMPFKYTMNLLNISVIALFILEFLVCTFCYWHPKRLRTT